MDLIKYDAACNAIAEARNIDEVKDIADKAQAMMAYARQAKNKEMEVGAAEIRIRAERRLGEMLAASERNKGMKGFTTGSKKVPVVDPTPTLASIGIDKKLSARAQKMAAVPEAEFEGMVGEWKEKVSQETERVTTNILKRGEQTQRDQQLETPVLPEGEFNLIYVDPPWRYEYSKTISREIENQYPTMDLQEICDMDIPSSPDCILFLWATSPKVAESIEVINAWGFIYRTCAVWDKEIIGMGYYFRQQHELLLVATKGKPGTPDPGERVSSVIRSRREKHSQKPECVYEIIEKMYPDSKRLELFSRKNRNGWASFGNQINA